MTSLLYLMGVRDIEYENCTDGTSVSGGVREHGDKATIYAGMEADAALEAGDVDAAATGRSVLRAIREMIRIWK